MTVTAKNPVGSDSVTITLRVTRVATTVTLTGPADATAGRPVDLVATVAGGDPPTGTVTFTSGSTTLGTADLDDTGQASLSTAKLPAGTDTVSAAYSGDGTFAASTSKPLTVTVAAAPTPTPSSSAPPTPPLAQTGSDTRPLLFGGAGLLLAGALALGLGIVGRRAAGRHQS